MTYRRSQSRFTKVDTKPARRIRKTGMMSSTAVQSRFDVIYRDHVEHRAADALSWLHTDREERTDLDDELANWNVVNMEVIDGEKCNVHVWTKKDVEKDVKKIKHNQNHIKNEKGRLIAVQLTKRLATKGEVPTIKEFKLEQTEDAYCR